MDTEEPKTEGTGGVFALTAIFAIALGAFLVGHFILVGPLDPHSRTAAGVNAPAMEQQAAPANPVPPPPPANPS